MQTHVNAIRKLIKYMPITDVALEINHFAFAAMEDPQTSGIDLQKGALKGFADVKAAVYESQHGVCLMSDYPIEHYHRIVSRHKSESDTLKNIVGLYACCQ